MDSIVRICRESIQNSVISTQYFKDANNIIKDKNNDNMDTCSLLSTYTECTALKYASLIMFLIEHDRTCT